MTAHVGIDENEIKDALTKERRKHNNVNINLQKIEKAEGLVIFVDSKVAPKGIKK